MVRKGLRNLKAILHVIDSTEPGGAETVFIELADRLRSRGYRSVVVVAGPGWVNDESIRRGFAPVELRARGSFNLGYLFKLVRLIRKERIDIVQSHLLGSNVYCGLAGWITGTPVIGTFHGMVDVSPKERFKSLKMWAMNRGIRRFITVSRALSREVTAQKLLNPARTEVVYNGIDTSRFRLQQPASLRSRLGLSERARIVLAIGNLHVAKGYDVLIRAAAMLPYGDDAPHTNVVIGGSAREPLLSELKALVASLGLAGRVHFLGFVEDTAPLFVDADVYVLSSVSEGFSISTLEALASGTPVVATRCGGPEEIVTDEVTALLVPAKDPGSLSLSIERLLADRILADKLRANGLEVMNNQFSITRMIDEYERIYLAAVAEEV